MNIPSDLLSQFPEEHSEAKDTSIMTDDAIMRRVLQDFGPVEAMRVMREAADAAATECHNRAHELGRMSFEEFSEGVFTLVIPECHSGFYHGAIEAYFRKNGTARLAQNLRKICTENLNGFFAHQCLHGIGHGLMAWSDYALPDALEYCNLIPESGGQSSCRTGVFMENIVGSLNDSKQAALLGHISTYVSDDPHYPCTVVKDEYKYDCYYLQTDRMSDLAQGDFEIVTRNCEDAPEEYRHACFQSMGRTISGMFRGNPEEELRACSFALERDHRIECMLGAGQDTFWDPGGEDLALAYCQAVPAEEGQAECYAMIITRSREILSEAEQTRFCKNLPRIYVTDCLSQES
ncbi:hypothetical protein HYZ99_05765 [Candidatus Peregrinibacteria bacterium]|nr:hypothetical protein [Candidatus Peregrinibacteria bacterium]